MAIAGLILSCSLELSLSDLFLYAADDVRQDAAIGNFRDYIRRSVRKDEPALEIGASFNPTLEKRAGYSLTIADVSDETRLKEIYARDGQDVSRIEVVDHIWQSGPLSALAGRNKFSAVVAAHMIEHAPDMLGFLNDAADMLTEGGRLYLIIPDRRYCFDYFQPISDSAKVIADHERKAQRHTLESFYRHGMHTTAMQSGSSLGAWTQGQIDGLSIDRRDPHEMLTWARESSSAIAYVDSHANVFTPASFALIIAELSYLKMTDLRIDLLTRARYCEFLAVLVRGATPQTLQQFIDIRLALSLRRLSEESERLRAAQALLSKTQIFHSGSPVARSYWSSNSRAIRKLLSRGIFGDN